MLRGREQDPTANTPENLIGKIKQLLEHQRFAVERAASIGMSVDEAAGMQARINRIMELLDKLPNSK